MFDKLKIYQYPIFLAVCIGLISFISFNLGKISSQEKGEITVRESSEWSVESSDLQANIYSASDNPLQSTVYSQKELDLRVVVSKNSDKYHYSWCGSWKRIKEENQVWFDNEQEAVNAGYTLAGNCSK